jgi:hypothetical protein
VLKPVTEKIGKEDAASEQVGTRWSIHLSFDHLDSVDVAFDHAGTPAEGQPGGDGFLIAAEPFPAVPWES